ncbi:hypothetical protein PV326_006938, partial [Microctonus aethiopoides]
SLLGGSSVKREASSYEELSGRLYLLWVYCNSPLSSANAGTSNIKSAAAAERGYKWSKRRQSDIRRDVKDSQDATRSEAGRYDLYEIFPLSLREVFFSGPIN